ncbi:MAG: CsgG/HfaB family protein, partial [Spirochaetaceae bacterium]|nr:CsgG/HfaB family protein [Spirochaetaceae bacterium]
SAGNSETEIIVQRADMPVNAGFKERIYIDGKLKLTLTNGGQGKIIVPNGRHTIHADLYTLTTDKLEFTAESKSMTILITPYSVHDFAIEQVDGNGTSVRIAESTPRVPARPADPPAPAARTQPAERAPARTRERSTARSSRRSSSSRSSVNAKGIEGSLARAAEKIIETVPPKSRMAIVYVTAADPDVAEFIAGELEFIMVEEGLTLIDRSQLDKIRQEQKFQFSGEVDDAHAISIGKIAGADVIFTGAVTGTGDLRRLRIRALSTQTAQVMVAASERY